MTRFAPAFYTLAWIIMGFAFAFLVPAAWAAGTENLTHVLTWLECGVFTFATGCWLWLRTRNARDELTIRNGFLLVNLVWIVLPAYAALPLVFTVHGLTWTKAYFEAMSALTATGATALAGLDILAPAVNIWRCFLQLIGALGIMLLAVAVLPFLGLGAMNLYKAETAGPMKDTRLTPRIAQTARGLWTTYFIFSIACFLAYRAGGMTWADAFMHMCTTMGLGGLSSHDQSFGYWNSPTLEWIAIVFMAISGISFARYFLVWRNRSFTPLSGDAEVRSYMVVLIAATLVVGAMLALTATYSDYATTVREATFQTVSMATGTGFSTTNYAAWPTFVPALLLFLGCFVPCAGSTGAGIKMVRMLVLVRVAQRELLRIIHPHAVQPIRLGRVNVPSGAAAAVMGFMLIYGGLMVGLTLLMLASGLDEVTAFSAVIACLNNIGPGLGRIGPAGNYASLTDFQLWVCSAAMLFGRLELLSVLVLFTPHFWRR